MLCLHAVPFAAFCTMPTSRQRSGRAPGGRTSRRRWEARTELHCNMRNTRRHTANEWIQRVSTPSHDATSRHSMHRIASHRIGRLVRTRTERKEDESHENEDTAEYEYDQCSECEPLRVIRHGVGVCGVSSRADVTCATGSRDAAVEWQLSRRIHSGTDATCGEVGDGRAQSIVLFQRDGVNGRLHT
jgi:hypothetical protein